MARITEWTTEDLERRAVELRVKAEDLEDRGYTSEAEESRRIYGAMHKELVIRHGGIKNPTRDTFRLIGFSDADVARYVALHGEPV